jgi:hypothetical protein
MDGYSSTPTRPRPVGIIGSTNTGRLLLTIVVCSY